MSSEEDNSSPKVQFISSTLNHSTNKRRKLMRACDFCRHKKVKCDAPDKPKGEKCSTCVLHIHDCTFNEGAKRRGPSKGYLQYLENRVDRLEEALRHLAPTYDIENSIGHRYNQTSWTTAIREVHPPLVFTEPEQGHSSPRPRPLVTQNLSLESNSPKPQSTNAATPILQTQPVIPARDSSTGLYVVRASDSANSSDEEGFTPAGFFGVPEDDLPEQLSKLQLGTTTFFGKSSNVHLLSHAMSMKNEITGRNDSIWPQGPTERTNSVWGRTNPWEDHQPPWIPSADRLKFPPQDLSDALITSYFRFFHSFFPILHRSSFEALVKDGTHKKYLSFGVQFLLVCAIGSRWSEDPRVCQTPDEDTPESDQVDWKIAGWPFFSQVVHLRRHFSDILRLHDLQNTVLFGFFELVARTPYSMWLIAGHGVRCAMELGAHRRKAYRQDRPLQNEIWKRTFWSLVNLDRMASSSLGRPSAVNDEDIDADLPLDVDDSSWDDTLQSWKPTGKPSHVQYFIHSTKLSQITAFAMRTIYSVNKSGAHLGPVGEEWERHIVSDLDSALNKWVDDMPNHLRWDPNIADPVFFDQAVALNVNYHNAQIIIHRRFLPGLTKKPSSLAYASLAICTNAARSISHIVDAHLKWVLTKNESLDPEQRYPAVIPVNPGAPFLAGVVLLIAIWGAKKSGGHVDVAALSDDVQKVLRYIRFAAKRHILAGRLLQALSDLASFGDVPRDLGGEGSPIKHAPKRSRAEADDGLTSPQETQSLQNGNLPTSSTIRSLFQESSAALAPGRIHPRYHGPLLVDPPALTLADVAQFTARQKVPQNPMASMIASDTPFLVPSDIFPSKSGFYGSDLNFTTPSPNYFATATLPVTSAAPLPSSSQTIGPSQHEPDLLGPMETQYSSWTGASASNGQVSLHTTPLETAYSMGVENADEDPIDPSLNNAEGVDPAAAAYFKALASGPDIGYSYPSQILGLGQASELGGPDGGYSQHARWNSSPPYSQAMAAELMAGPASVDWGSWMNENRSLYRGVSPSQSPLNAHHQRP